MAFRVSLTEVGGTTLRQIAAELRSMDDARVGQIFRDRVSGATRPMVGAIRGRILAIPAHGPRHTGLRIRLAACVSYASGTQGNYSSVAVYMDVRKMPPGQMALPITMEGLKVWRHPVFGDRADWVTQAPHPYFYGTAAAFSGSVSAAIDAAAEQIVTDLSGR